MGLELKDRLPSSFESESEPSVESGGDMKVDLRSALANLGYHRPVAERAIDRALAAGAGSFEQMLRRALQELAR